MAKKSKQTKFDNKLNLDTIKVGDIIPDLHGEDVEITEDLIEQMKAFEKDTKKSAIWRSAITGNFLLYKWTEEHPEKKGKEVIEEELEEIIEEQVENEENMLLDCIEDYKAEFGVKKVNTNTKKFQKFFEEWKKSN